MVSTLDPAAEAYLRARAEVKLSGRRFVDFLEHVTVDDPPPGAGLLKFERWPHLMEAAMALVTFRLIVIIKARQLGLSWLLAAFAVWMALFKPRSIIFLFSKGEDEAKVFLAKVKTVYDNLPTYLKAPLESESRSELVFANGSKIKAFPSTQDAGRSETASLVIQDEADFHPWLAANYSAVKPTIDAGGQLVMLSTVNKRNMLSLFKALVRDAMAKRNDFKWLFFGWNARPGRDEAWYRRTKAEAPASEGMTPDLYMEQEYPSTVEEALAPSAALAFFKRDALTALLQDCQEPKSVRRGIVKIWAPPVVARKYVGFGDVSWGQTGAYCCFTIAEWQTGLQVAEIYGRLDHDVYAKEIADLVGEYNSTYFSIEANGEGDSERSGLNVINKLIDLGLGDRMYHHGENWKKDARQRGWLTTPVTRPVMVGELEEAVRLDGVRPRCKDVIGEMMTFVIDEKGKAMPQSGSYADHVMSWAGLVQMRKYARWGSGTGNAMDWGW